MSLPPRLGDVDRVVRWKSEHKPMLYVTSQWSRRFPYSYHVHGRFSEKERPHRRGAAKVNRSYRLIQSAHAPQMPGLEVDVEPELHLPGRSRSNLPWQ